MIAVVRGDTIGVIGAGPNAVYMGARPSQFRLNVGFHSLKLRPAVISAADSGLIRNYDYGTMNGIEPGDGFGNAWQQPYVFQFVQIAGFLYNHPIPVEENRAPGRSAMWLKSPVDTWIGVGGGHGWVWEGVFAAALPTTSGLPTGIIHQGEYPNAMISNDFSAIRAPRNTFWRTAKYDRPSTSY